MNPTSLSQSTVPSEGVDQIDQWEAAADSGNTDAMFFLGYLYMEKKRCGKALYWIQRGAIAEDPNCMTALGILFRTGSLFDDSDGHFRAVPIDLEKSYSWLLKASKTNQPDAEYELGNWYAQQGNIEGALSWYRKAEQEGSRPAAKRLGDMHRFGLGMEKDLKQARVFYMKAGAKEELEELNHPLWAKIKKVMRYWIASYK